MPDDPDPRFVMRRITSSEWVINDLRFAPDDTRHVVACVYELTPTEVDVVWLRDLPLRGTYTTAFEVLEDLERMQAPSRATKPVQIRHLPPLLAD